MTARHNNTAAQRTLTFASRIGCMDAAPVRPVTAAGRHMTVRGRAVVAVSCALVASGGLDLQGVWLLSLTPHGRSPEMASPMTETQVRTTTDIDALWTSFLDARRRGDDGQAELIRARMAELQEARTLEELDDEQLLAQIAHLQQSEEAEAGEIDLGANPPGPVARLSALLSEAARRGL